MGMALCMHVQVNIFFFFFEDVFKQLHVSLYSPVGNQLVVYCYFVVNYLLFAGYRVTWEFE